MSRRYPPGPANFNASFALTWRHAFWLCHDPLNFVTWAEQTYGDIVFYRLFTHTAYQVNHPDLIREVLITKARSFHKQDRQMNVIRQVAGDGLLTAEGERWMRQRRIMLPAFQAAGTQQMAEIALAQTSAALQQWRPGSEIDLNEAFNTLFVRIVSESFFGIQTDAEARWLGDQINTISRGMLDQITWLGTLPAWLPGSSRWRQRKAQECLLKYVEDAIVRRRNSPAARRDLLSVLLDAVDVEGDARGMSDAQARCEAVTLFFAGHHTSAATLTWTLYLLSQNPAQYDTLMAEIDRVLEGHPPTIDDAARLPYTEMVLKESMRIYPPAWALFAREAIEDVQIGGYDLPRGAWVLIYPFAVHRSSQHYPDPLRFDPERFAPERASAIPSGAYIPFGLGPHTCVGNRMAMTTNTLVLASILQRYKFALAPGQSPPIPEPLVSIRPKRGLRVIPQLHPAPHVDSPNLAAAVVG
jgi:cytochrome P450